MTVEEVLELRQLPDEREWQTTRTDVERLFWKLKWLRLEQNRKESFWSATNENLQRAYAQLERQEHELERAYGQIQRYLENINEGLLLIDRDLIIQDQYSVYLRELFKTRKIEGRNLIDFLYPNPTAQEAERDELKGFLDILFSSRNASDQMINEVNPLLGKVITVGEAQTEQRAIDARFTRIMGDSEVDSVMVIFLDRTHEIEMKRKLEIEETRHESELETISAILRNGPAALLDFIEESTSLVDALKRDWSRLAEVGLRTELFKKVHSLKGVAKYFGLHHVASLAHELEDLISAVDGGKSVNREQFYRIIEQLENGISGIHGLNDKLMQFAGSVSEHSGESPTARFLESIREMVAGLASELEKQVTVVAQHGGIEIPHLSSLQKPLIHLVRNAIDHGVEDPYQRLSSSKPMMGTVTIAAREEGGACVVDVQDDGAGIDFEGVRRRAEELGLLAPGGDPSPADLLKVIFSPHFSSNQRASEVSGRGLGLDIVRDVVRELGGRVTVSTSRGKGTRIRMIIPSTGA